MKRERKNEKGFTMVELIIVVAIMGIIGALLVPSFGNMAAKSKISTDISTTKTIKRLIDAYAAEGGDVTALTNKTTIGQKLFAAGYLETDKIDLQTNGELVYTVANPTATPATASMLKLDLSVAAVTDANVKAVSQKMAADTDTYGDWLTPAAKATK